MKQSAFILTMLAALVCASCKSEMPEEPVQDIQAPSVISAVIESFDDAEESKTFVGDDLRVLWTTGDEINIFYLSTASQRYVFTGETGDRGGDFAYVSGESTAGVYMPLVLASYPYRESTGIDDAGYFQFELPGVQSYAPGSFGLGANPMIAIYYDNSLLFKNACGYLMFRLYGSGAEVSSLTLRANGGEVLAGNAHAGFDDDLKPIVFNVDGNSASPEIVLQCTSPVALGADASSSTEFWFVVPPVTFSGGFTLQVNLADGSIFQKTISSEFTVKRNTRTKVAPLGLDTLTPLYSTDGIVSLSVKTEGTLASLLKSAKETIGSDSITSLSLSGTLNSTDMDALYNLKGITYLDLRSANVPSGFQYWYDQSIEYLYLPDSLTELGSSALSSNHNLKYVYGRNVATIGYSALSQCYSLEDYYLPEVTYIDANAFSSCTSLTYLDFPKATTLKPGCFADCSSVKTVSLESLQVLENGVFSWYAPFNIESIYLPNVIKVGDSAFKGQQKLKELNLPSVKEIGYQIISDSSIEKIVFHSLEKIPKSAFAGNLNLRYVYGKKVKWVGPGAFQGCERLKDVSLPNADTFEASAFYGCTLGGDLEFYSLMYIGESCFENSSGIGSSIVLLPLTVSIGDKAFMNCTSLVAIEIPLAVLIGDLAFYGCTHLSLINADNTLITTSLGDYAFANCTALGSLNFPYLTKLGSSCFDQSGLRSLRFECLPWQRVNEYGFPEAPFEFWQFPIDETCEHISLFINSVDLPPEEHEDSPWWEKCYDEEWRVYYTFLRKRWSSVDLP